MNIIITVLCFFGFILSMLLIKVARKIVLLTNAVNKVGEVNNLLYKLKSAQMKYSKLENAMKGGGTSSGPPSGGPTLAPDDDDDI